MHDSQGQLKLSSEDLKTFENILDKLPKRWPEFSGYRKELVRGRPAPFKCRAGSRYLYVEESELVLTNPKHLVQAAAGLHAERFAAAVLQLQIM